MCRYLQCNILIGINVQEIVYMVLMNVKNIEMTIVELCQSDYSVHCCVLYTNESIVTH